MRNIQGQLTSPRENIRIGKLYRRSAIRFFAFLTCIAILTAAFATSGLWLNREYLFGKNEPADNNVAPPNTNMPSESINSNQEADKTPPIPEGATSILSLDLSFQANGLSILQNETVYLSDF